MRFSTIASTLATASIASARIVGVATPSTLAPNATFPITLINENYIQAVSEIAAAWGFETPARAFPYTLGQSGTASSYLGPTFSTSLENVTLVGTVPGHLENGSDYVFSVAVMSLYGASHGPITESWNVTVKIGQDQDDEDIVASRQLGWKQTTA
ncbi:hypothetical protein HBI56_219410 [Parastagonospora nodorum]|uniref:Uncharacterized protein n=2 Tax=Phaeosphaeria nodorum (strain SN15 / ATCC MYA-4574 / FGSC 10173) TaxID=321614 RepID=A0A7U2EPD7_PHANO|nr:hypothetical protein SNOG_00069 [Parastagonospora nodorum SN15]KAH3920641.1 hypothetical protein HBH56_007710 [Parastagonospora nodorum]EAT91564.1 hypothetical protein SNOG_00069 [Parastagonospora nodorum SN15]KAH3922154.1 hypothetical protein HBH54_228080 [Parastagonospora nodorum]KAH3940253.1 hypothetical protein HBH53_219630 [Parastagonospora nodorum]KAH3960071.1 hypothetical protein HBH52_239490 [Parastagonospora nodorum]